MSLFTTGRRLRSRGLECLPSVFFDLEQRRKSGLDSMQHALGGGDLLLRLRHCVDQHLSAIACITRDGKRDLSSAKLLEATVLGVRFLELGLSLCRAFLQLVYLPCERPAAFGVPERFLMLLPSCSNFLCDSWKRVVGAAFSLTRRQERLVDPSLGRIEDRLE